MVRILDVVHRERQL